MEQIQLSNFSFEGDNNVYLFDEDETVLVDTGDWMAETREQLAATLEEYDVAFADVDRVLLTHWHGDHTGLVGIIQEASDCEVYAHEADAPLIEGDEAAWDAMKATQRELFDQWGMPADDQAVLEDIFESSPDTPDPSNVTRLTDGDIISVGERTFEAVHAPGHAAGLCIYETEIEGHRDALTGDALLPQYTPNVGGADVRVDRPLEQYLETLQGIVEADYDRAWPGHRDVITEPAARAEFIIDHHEERAWRVLDALDRLGSSNAWEVSADLFGDLESIHILHGPGEAYAHLEHLQREGDVVREGDGYRVTERVSEAIRARADERWPLVGEVPFVQRD